MYSKISNNKKLEFSIICMKLLPFVILLLLNVCFEALPFVYCYHRHTSISLPLICFTPSCKCLRRYGSQILWKIIQIGMTKVQVEAHEKPQFFQWSWNLSLVAKKVVTLPVLSYCLLLNIHFCFKLWIFH